MRELLLLRHAEAMTAGPDGRDTERPLSLRGEAQASAAGAWLAEHHAAPDAVLCSPARRAQMTADAVGKALRMPQAQFVHAIYHATPGELLALLTEGRSAGARGMSPATVAWIELTDGALEPGHGRLHALWSP